MSTLQHVVIFDHTAPLDKAGQCAIRNGGLFAHALADTNPFPCSVWLQTRRSPLLWCTRWRASSAWPFTPSHSSSVRQMQPSCAQRSSLRSFRSGRQRGGGRAGRGEVASAHAQVRCLLHAHLLVVASLCFCSRVAALSSWLSAAAEAMPSQPHRRRLARSARAACAAHCVGPAASR